MAGPTVSKIYCWQIKFGDLNIYMASTKKGAIRIGLALKIKRDCTDFFKKIFPSTDLFKDYRANKLLIRAIEDSMLNKQTLRMPDLDISCSPFQWRVYEAITKIPFGATKTYGKIASMIGMPEGARAVGQALGKNPLPLIFP